MPIDAQQALGARVRVVSGPHEGRSGTVTLVRDVQTGYSDPEPYAIVEYQYKNEDDGRIVTDSVSVPVRRLDRA